MKKSVHVNLEFKGLIHPDPVAEIGRDLIDEIDNCHCNYEPEDLLISQIRTSRYGCGDGVDKHLQEHYKP